MTFHQYPHASTKKSVNYNKTCNYLSAVFPEAIPAIITEKVHGLHVITTVAHKGHIDFFRRKLRSQVSKLRSQVSKLRSQVSKLRSQVSKLRSQVSKLRSQVNKLRSQVSKLRSQVSKLRSQVSKLRRKKSMCPL